MCGPSASGPRADGPPRPLGPSRRKLILAGAAAPLLLRLTWASPAAALDGVDVQPRATWGADLLPTGPLSQEAPGDVRFLLVHHAASGNGYAQGEVPGILRGFYGFHTTNKGWPDIAYNFLVDRFGRAWEGRTGSLSGPVKGDATGGSQGFALLCCFIGDHTTAPPSAAAQVAMGALLGSLAVRYGIDVSPGTTTSFISRGSNRFPVGTPVTAQTISGHRDMSYSECPGDACYPLIHTFVTSLPPCPVATAGPTAPSAPILATPVWQATYVSLTPARLMDTRSGGQTIDGVSAGGGPVGPCSVRPLTVTGRGGVPGTGVGAVVLNVTAAGSTTGGFLTVFPTGDARPLASNLNFGPGQTIPNLVIARVGGDGSVSIYNDRGFTQLIVDVAGWFPTGSSYNAVAPARLIDTRPGGTTIDGIFAGGGALGPGETVTFTVAGRGAVLASGVGAAVLNITAAGPTAGGFLTVHPTAEPRPLASNLNFEPGQTIANLVIAKLGSNGEVSVYNTGSTHLIADVAGWYPAGTDYNAMSPARLVDSRPDGTTIDGVSAGGGAVGPRVTRTLLVAGRGGMPKSGVGAVVLNVTATGATTGGFLTVFPTGEARPLASNLNFGPGQTIANLVIAKVGADGTVSIYNDAGSAHLIADVAGWFHSWPA